MREHIPSVLVAALSAAFGVGLLQITGFMAAAIAGDDVTGSSRTVGLLLSIVAIVFIVIAVYVSAIITANTFAHHRGRPRAVDRAACAFSAPAPGRSARPSPPRACSSASSARSIGSAIGTGVAFALARISIGLEIVPENSYGYWDPVLILPARRRHPDDLGRLLGRVPARPERHPPSSAERLGGAEP